MQLPRELAASDPEKQQPALAYYIEQYGVMLHNAGRLDDACATKAEAVTVRQQLYEKNPDKHRAQLATYLEQHGITVHAAGRWEEACEAKRKGYWYSA